MYTPGPIPAGVAGRVNAGELAVDGPVTVDGVASAPVEASRPTATAIAISSRAAPIPTAAHTQ
jgi:hypothetical protein